MERIERRNWLGVKVKVLSCIFTQVLLLAFLFSLPEVLAQEDESENLLTNGDFEEGEMDEYVGRIVPGWRIIGRNAKYIKPYVHLDTEVAFSGERTLRIESKSIKDGDGNILKPSISSSNIPIEPGEVYEYSIWVKGERPGLKVLLIIDGWTTGVKHWFRQKRIEVTDEWKKYSITAKIPGEGDGHYSPLRKTIYVRVDLPEDGRIWVDYASFKKVGEN